VLSHLPHLDALRRKAQAVSRIGIGKQAVQRAAAADTSPAGTDDDHSLPALFARHAITHFQCTPSMATMLAADDAARPGLGRLRHMMVGGEAFPPVLATTLHNLVAGRVTNMYGPTETTIWSAVGDLDGTAGTSVSIGRPLPNQRVYVLDARQRPLPPGIAGELFIAGDGVVRGYWQRQGLTAERFLPDPARTGERMYRTGDLGRHLEDGRLECLGRVDQQVKIRGYRVELGEIEALLRGHAGVRDAAVLLREDSPGDQRLVAYVRVHDGKEVPTEGLVSWLRRQLPEFMVPSAYVFLAALPLTPNGKLDRRALPAPQSQARSTQAYAPPRNEVEAMVSEIWQRALGIPQVGTQDNFFDIGGHSLLVVQVLKELRERLARPIQMTDLFRYTTIEALASFLGGEEAAPRGSERGRSRADARRSAMQRRRN
jgi:acyl-coenzyme A synthetase/AMP-(fatty) acid ligase/acyl carrier protein